MRGSNESFSMGLGLRAGLAVSTFESPSDRGGSCGGSEGRVGGNEGSELVLFFLESRKEGGAGSAFEKRDRPVLGVRRVEDSILSFDSVSPAE